MTNVQASPQDAPAEPASSHPKEQSPVHTLAVPYTVPAPRAIPEQRTLWIPPGPGFTPEQLRTEVARFGWPDTGEFLDGVMAAESPTDALTDESFDPHVWSGEVLTEILADATELIDQSALLSDLTAASKRSSDAGPVEAEAWEVAWPPKKVQRIPVSRDVEETVPTKAVRKPAARKPATAKAGGA